MPRSSEVTLTCACGEHFAATVYHTVNVTLEPRLLYRLLAGQLNVATCPNCGRQVEMTQPFIYHDMRRGLLAYVYHRSDVEQEDREVLLEHLRRAYVQAVEEAERLTHAQEQRMVDAAPKPAIRRRSDSDDADALRATLEPEAPPMQVIFGVSELTALVDSLLEPEEKLGRVALTARNPGAAEKERLLSIARRMAGQTACETMVEEDGEEYTIWLYGSRATVNMIARALHTSA
jgi:hypothetical protein